MLSFLLETLHEDLNTITKKPYVEQKDSDDRPDALVSAEYWEGFKRRERSIFVDLFYGQLKSRVQCTVCGKVSISFDPFNMLSLPIPQATRDTKFSIKYIPLSLAERPIDFTFQINDLTTFGDIKQKIQDNLSPSDNKEPPFITRVKAKSCAEILGKEKLVKPFLERVGQDAEIYAYERIPLPQNHEDNFLLVEVKLLQNRRSYYLMKGIHQFGVSRLFIYDKRWTVR